MSGPGFFLLGTTHHRAPLAVREKLALDAAAAAALQAELATLAGLRELAVLNTCNRIEFYGVADHPETVARIEAAFCARQRFEPAAFAACRLSLAGRAAVQHLFEVAAGLDSQMLGETEIFGQVKDAYAAALERKSAGAVLNRIFQKTFQAAKQVRTQTAITAGQVSVANVAVDLALDIFGHLGQTRILLLGAGDIGEKTAKAFQSRGAASLTVASRHLERAMELATQFGASALPFELREARLGEFDVVVGSTAAPDTVISAAAVALAIRRRPARPLFFIDLALPRDIEPAVAEIENVFLYNLDDLAKIAERNRAARHTEATRARALLAEKADALWSQVAPRTALSAALPPSAENSPASG
jgi:glutamyl-tRNA reductase